MSTEVKRSAWISYLRVSTPEQAERELSLPAQRRAVEEHASRHGVVIAREYVDSGRSGASPSRPAFRAMLEDALRPASDVATVLVHHTSRFTRDSTEARVVKAKLRRIGVRVVSACQEMPDDPMGKLVEGVFECIDQYESEVNGARTSAAMRESVRQGYFPGAKTPFGYATRAVEIRPGVTRHVLVPKDAEASVVREVYRLYVSLGGAKAVARNLNQRKIRYRTSAKWTKDIVLHVLDETAVTGTYWWGQRRAGRVRPRAEWLSLKVESIVDTDVYEVAQRLRASREPSRSPGRAAAKPHLLTGLVRCGRCGGAYQLRRPAGKSMELSIDIAITIAGMLAERVARSVADFGFPPTCSMPPSLSMSRTPCARLSESSCSVESSTANEPASHRGRTSPSRRSHPRGARSSRRTRRSGVRTPSLIEHIAVHETKILVAGRTGRGREAGAI